MDALSVIHLNSGSGAPQSLCAGLAKISEQYVIYFGRPVWSRCQIRANSSFKYQPMRRAIGVSYISIVTRSLSLSLSQYLTICGNFPFYNLPEIISLLCPPRTHTQTKKLSRITKRSRVCEII